MTRINLIPPEKRRERARRAPGAPGAAGAGSSAAWLLFIIPLVVLVVMLFMYFSASSKVKNQQTALKKKQSDLADWQSKNQQLAKYAARVQEIATTEGQVVSALKGRVYWARILNEIAIMIPSDVWLTSLNGSASASAAASSTGGGGTVSFEVTALQCPNRLHKATMYPYLPDYRPVAGWLEKMAQIIEFQRVWMTSASPTQIQTGTVAPTTPGAPAATTSVWVMRFSSQATLNMQTATIGGSLSSAPAAPTSSTPTPSSSSAPSAPGGR